MQVDITTDPAALEELADAWGDLWERDPDATIFHTPTHARIAWETELGADRELALVTVRDDALVGLCGFTLDPDGTLRFLGNAEITDYLGPLAARADRDSVARAVIDAATKLDWNAAELLCVAGDTGWAPALAEAARAAGLDVEQRAHDVCPRIDVTGGWDAYLARLPQKLRHEIRRKARRLEREGGPFAVRLTGRETLDRDLEAFFEMHRSSVGQKGKFMHDDMAEVFRRLARAFDERGWLRLAWLDVGGTPMAATLSFVERGVWSVYNSAYDHQHRELGPGMVLMGETIRLAADEGCAVVDLLRGDEPYKYRFGARDVALHALTLARSREGSALR